MSGERLNSGITAGLIACLSVGILLLGVELSSAAQDGARLSAVNAAVLAGAAVLLYAALAWRGSQGKGALFLRLWGTMVLGHALLGITVGLANATLVSSPADARELALWAGAASLPMVVLQAGYSIGVSSLAWGNQEGAPIGVDEATDLQLGSAAAVEPPPAPPRRPDETPAGAPHLEVYASAVERLRANDHQTLVRFATQAAKCEGGVLATNDGLVIAAIEPSSLDPTRVAAVLPQLVRDLKQLTGPAAETPTMLHAALGGHELLAVPGKTLTACLIGPQPGAREAAEVILPVLVARAEELRVRGRRTTGCPHSPADSPPDDRETLS